MSEATITARAARMLVAITEVERVTTIQVYEGYDGALGVSLPDGRVIYVEPDGTKATEYPTSGGSLPWPTRPAARTALCALYPTLARRQGILR